MDLDNNAFLHILSLTRFVLLLCYTGVLSQEIFKHDYCKNQNLNLIHKIVTVTLSGKI